MEIRTSTVAVIAASCITVGAAGAFLANRPSRAPQPAPAADVAPAGVEQSEAVVSDAPVAPAIEPEPAPAQPKKAAPAAPPQRPAEQRAAEPPRAPAPAPKPVQQVASAPPAPVFTPPPVAAPVARAESRTEPTAPTAPPGPVEPKGPQFVDLVVSTDSVLGLQIETALTSEKARVEDEVLARVTRDVRVGDRVAIPAGSQAKGEVTMVERGGKVKDKARLGVRFTSVVLADGTVLRTGYGRFPAHACRSRPTRFTVKATARRPRVPRRLAAARLAGPSSAASSAARKAPPLARQRAPARAPRRSLRAAGTPRRCPPGRL